MSEKDIRNAQAAPDLIEAAIASAKDDPGAAFEMPVLDELRRIRRDNPADYQRTKAKFKNTGTSVGELDRLTHVKHDVDDGAQGSELKFTEDEPWDESVDGAELLDEITDLLRRYMVLGQSQARAVALWIVFTYLHAVAAISPILLVTSPLRRCGKTRLVSLLLRLCRRAEVAGNISAAGVFRTIEKFSPTLITDEADTFFDDNDELRGVYNSGHTRDTAYVVRISGNDLEPRRFSTWAPKVLARIGLPRADTIIDRAIVIDLQRKTSTEKVERLRRRHVEPELTILRRKCVQWAQDNAEYIEAAEPDLPEQLHDRAADNWEPLFAIADQVSGKWPKLARLIACELTSTEIADDTIDVQLLADIRGVFGNQVEIGSASLVSKLNALEDRPWAAFGKRGGGLTQHSLARLLYKFKIGSRTVHPDGPSLMGYKRKQFAEVWRRYLPSSHDSGFQSTQVRKASNGAGFGGNQSTQEMDSAYFENGRNANTGAGLRSCVLQNGKSEGEGGNRLETDRIDHASDRAPGLAADGENSHIPEVGDTPDIDYVDKFTVAIIGGLDEAYIPGADIDDEPGTEADDIDLADNNLNW